MAAVLAACSITAHDVIDYAPLAGGTYNTVSRVTLRDGQRLVVKLPPDNDAGSTLTYEHDLLRAEVDYYQAAAAIPGTPVPHVLHTGLGPGKLVAGLVMTERPGTPWHEAEATLSTGERAALREELGTVVARLHTLTGPGFGYPGRPLGRPLADTWREAFTAMMEALLADAERYHARLPTPVADLRKVFAAGAEVLDDVTRPALVHFDLWPGNLLLDGDPGGDRRLSGLIDGERMFWGDPVAEFVSLALFDNLERDEAFLGGYAAAGGAADFDDSVRRRLALYRCYLYLIMLIEVVPRRSSPGQRDWVWRHAGGALMAALKELSAEHR